MSFALELSQLSKTYGRARAIESISVEIARGDSLALLGPNGAGKTTLLKLCSTLLRPSSGTLRVAGFDAVEHGIEVRRRIALLGHDTYLYPDLTALENLTFYARLYRVDTPERRVQDAVEHLGLSAFARRPVRTFSRGMLQRCTLARVLVQRPEILLLDEPFTGLDLAARAMLEAALGQLRLAGATLVMTTHDLDEALSLCSSALVLRRGRIAWHGALAADGRDDVRQHLAALIGTSPAAAL